MVGSLGLALVDGIERDMSHELDRDCTVMPILGESPEGCTFLGTHAPIYLHRQ